MRWRLLALLVVSIGTAVGDVFTANGYCNGMKINPTDYKDYDKLKVNEYTTELKFYTDCEMILGDFYILNDAQVEFKHLQEITGTLYIGGTASKPVIMPNLVVVHGESLFENEYSVVFDNYQGEYFFAPRFILIANGKLFVRNSPKLCNIKTSIEKKSLFRLAPNEVVNDRFIYINSFTTDCAQRRKCTACANFCWASDDQNQVTVFDNEKSCQHRPYDYECNCPKKDPITQSPACYLKNSKGTCCDESCDGACVEVKNLQGNLVLRCAACPKGKSLDSKTGKCITECGTIKFGNICKADNTCPTHLIKFNKRCHTECPLGMTVVNRGTDQDHRYECVGCPLTVNGDSLVGTCGRVCNVKVTPTKGQLTVTNIFKMWEHFGRFKYPDTQVNEAMLCDVLLGDIVVDALKVGDLDLWFLTRLRAIYGTISRNKNSKKPVLFFGNAYYIKDIVASGFTEGYLDITEGHNQAQGYGKVVEDKNCNCDGNRCFLPNHCTECPKKRQIIDDRTGFLATYCLSKNTVIPAYEFLDTTKVVTKEKANVPRRLVLPCHPACKEQPTGAWCTGETSFDCKACKLTLKTYNMITCVESCPLGYYQKGSECLRCHATCRQGCKGPDATMGPSGCNQCLSFVAPPADYTPKEPLCFKPPPPTEVSGRVAQMFERDRPK
uniref:Recep_L_domain domain-containing protein n=1 Tax=Panagrellus redivivus TaxID=6233 RepID=A0A7E4VFN9_PANRE